MNVNKKAVINGEYRAKRTDVGILLKSNPHILNDLI